MQHSLFFPNSVLVTGFPWESKMICHITWTYRAPVCNTPNLFMFRYQQSRCRLVQSHPCFYFHLCGLKRLTRWIIMDFMSKPCTHLAIWARTRLSCVSCSLHLPHGCCLFTEACIRSHSPAFISSNVALKKKTGFRHGRRRQRTTNQRKTRRRQEIGMIGGSWHLPSSTDNTVAIKSQFLLNKPLKCAPRPSALRITSMANCLGRRGEERRDWYNGSRADEESRRAPCHMQPTQPRDGAALLRTEGCGHPTLKGAQWPFPHSRYRTRPHLHQTSQPEWWSLALIL